jgi:hypothetical protein
LLVVTGTGSKLKPFRCQNVSKYVSDSVAMLGRLYVGSEAVVSVVGKFATIVVKVAGGSLGGVLGLASLDQQPDVVAEGPAFAL